MTDPGAGWPFPGARWWRLDFHAHTPASRDFRDNIAPREWLLACMGAGLDCVAVTDHNSGQWIDRLKLALQTLEERSPADFRPLRLFPGVELSVNGGFHLLAIFDFAATTADIDRLLGAVNYRGTRGSSDGVTGKSAVETVRAVLDAGAIPLPAHADGRKGLLEPRVEAPDSPRLDPQTLKQVLDSGEILAAEVVDPSIPKLQIYADGKLEWTEVLGSDAHESADLGRRYTWVKMASPSLDALRLALLDGAGYSIRRSDDTESFDPFRVPTHCVQGIRITDARYMGRGTPAEFRFSPWLNALVGGRGTGKSTVVHALRLVSRRECELTRLAEGSETRRTFDSFIRVPRNRMDGGALQRETKLEWSVLRDGVRHRVHWRTDGRGSVVRECTDAGEWVDSTSQAMPPERFPIRIFSQGQIAGLAADDRQALMHVVDEAANTATVERDLERARSSFYATRAKTREFDTRLSRRPDELVVKQADVERKLTSFEDAAHQAVLKEYRRRGRQQAELDRQFRELNEAAERIDRTAEDIELTDVPAAMFDVELAGDVSAAQIISVMRDAIQDAREGLRSVASSLRSKGSEQRSALGASAWNDAHREAAERYEALVGALRAVDVKEPGQYSALLQERRRLQSERELLESLREERDGLVERADEQLDEIARLRRRLSSVRRDFLAEVLTDDPFVRIELQPYEAEPSVLERQLREILNVVDDRFREDILSVEDGRPSQGIVAELVQELPEDTPDRSLVRERRLKKIKQRLESACYGEGDFGGYFNNYCEREFNRSPEFLDKLLAWFPKDGLAVVYSPTGDGRDFTPITQASAGQRSAAMLAFLLAHGDEPLVLDQPEDDLDNHLIYDLVVRQIRENKLRRQIIVVTHNPNVVVNGDAEMLHVMGFVAGQCRIQEEGSLQEREIRDEVCRVMEGGRDAFERRYRRLGA